MTEDFEFIAEVITENDEVKPIELGGGLIEYRKYLWALKFLKEKKQKLIDYRDQVMADIDKAIAGKNATIEHLEGEIKRAMLADPAVDDTPTGGKTMSIPDIASVSVSKLQKKIDIIDADEVLDALGNEFVKQVKPSLDVTKAKDFIEQSGVLPAGASSHEDRTFTIRFKK